MIEFSLIIILVIIAVLVFHHWRYGVIFIFIWLYVEDITRRLFPGQPAQVMLIKDVLLFLTYCSFFAMVVIKKKRNLWKPSFITSFLLFSTICLVNILNPNSPGPLFGIIGLRSYIWYTLLVFFGILYVQ